MSNVKIALVIAVLAIAYLLLFSSGLPRQVEFQGHTLGPRESVENNSTRNFDIYQYRDETNHRVLLLVMAVDETATAEQLLSFYASNFERQGFVFQRSGQRHLGRKGDEVIYLTQASSLDAAVAYIEKSPDAPPAGIRSAEPVFAELESLSL